MLLRSHLGIHYVLGRLWSRDALWTVRLHIVCPAIRAEPVRWSQMAVSIFIVVDFAARWSKHLPACRAGTENATSSVATNRP